MLKVSTFAAENEYGHTAIPLFGAADGEFEKVASPYLLPPVLQYVEGLRPRKNSQYVLVNALGAGEYFGCFPAGTLVETSVGEKPIEEIEPGEQVLTHKNRFRSVVAKVPKQAEELCDLYVQGLPNNVPALTATPNHELWVVAREDFVRTKRRVVWKGDTSTPLDERREQALKEMEFSWMPISDLGAGDYVAEPFPLEEDPKALGDEKWNCQAAAYLMGLYAAEGCVAYRYDRDDDREASIIYVISGEEQLVLDRARDFAASLGHGLQDYKSESGTSYRLQLCFAELARLCKKHIGTPSTEKRLSSAILRMPKGWQRVFWMAYREGDGCIRGEGKEKGTARAVSASPALLRGMRLLLARQGLVASISGRHNKKATWYTGNPIYELALSAGQVRGRGTPKSYLHPDGYILSSVKRVEQYDWQGEVFDLTVEEDSSFVASGVAVHNSNINGDHFPEAALIHAPEGWTGNPLTDRVLAKTWNYGFPTFYNAHPYAHHRNKDPSRAYGEVELAVWNDVMKRVELVVRIDYDKCCQFGGVAVWDKLKAGQFPDVSMGSKVPFDTSSISLDWELYRKAQSTYDPKKHRHPGQAVLEFHKRLKAKNKVGIRGVSITRNDYDEWCQKHMNRILPDGRKVFVYNDYPRFFDISFVFIGADRTAKTLVYIVHNGNAMTAPSAKVAHALGYREPDEVGPLLKVASVEDEWKRSLVKGAEEKKSEIEKEIVPSQLAAKAVPLLTKNEPHLPKELQDALASVPEDQALSTASGMGIVLRPAEFQRISLVRMGCQPLADALGESGVVFPKAPSGGEDLGLDPSKFVRGLGRLLAPMMGMRSALGPFIEKRVVIISSDPEAKGAQPPSHSSELLRKIGSSYASYRSQLMDVVPSAQDLIEKVATPRDGELLKVAQASAGDAFTPLSYCYMRDAFMDEAPIAKSAEAVLQTS